MEREEQSGKRIKKYGKEGDILFNRHYRNQEMGLNVFFFVLATSAEHNVSIGRRTEVNHRVSGRSNALLRVGGREMNGFVVSGKEQGRGMDSALASGCC